MTDHAIHLPPKLPSGYQWVTGLDEAERVLADQIVGLVHPGDQERAQRWARVLSWYTPDLPAPPDAPSPGDRLLVTVEAGCAGLGRVAARLLGRTHHHLDQIHDIPRLPVPAGGSVILAASAGACTLAALTVVEQHWRAANIRWGLLTGTDTAGMFFSLAKIVAARSDRSEQLSAWPDALVDGPASRAHLLPEADHLAEMQLPDVFSGEWRMLLIDAHGSSGHAFAAPYVLCGLTTATETLATGEPLAGGCTRQHCKMAPRDVLLPLAVREEIRAQILGAFVCNGITLGLTEQYPSNVSLARAASEGHPAATVGLLRQDADTTQLEPTVFARLLAAGSNLGRATMVLSEAAASRGLPTAYALLGDPDWTPIPANIPQVTGAAAPGTDALTMPLATPHHTTEHDHAEPALVTRSAVTNINHHDHIRLHDAEPDLSGLVNELRGWSQGLASAAAFENSLEALSAAQRSPDDVLISCLEQMRKAREQANTLVLATLRQVQSLRHTRQGPRPVDPIETLHGHARAWGLAVAEMATRSRVVLYRRIWKRLHEYHDLAERGHQGTCSYCDTPTDQRRFTATLPGIPDRIARSCPRCGPRSEHPATGCRLQIMQPPALSPGAPASVNVCICAPTETQPEQGVLLLQLRSRSAGRGPLDVVHQEIVAPTETSATLTAPRTLEPELHRIWALFAYRFQISITQTRTPCLP